MSAEEAKNAEKIDGVIVEKDYLLEGTSSDENVWVDGVDKVVREEWNIQAIHAEDAEEGKDQIKVAILDSGMDELSSIEIAGYKNFVDEDSTDDVYGKDLTGHGSAVNNIIMGERDKTPTEGVAGGSDKVSFYSVKILDENNQAPVSRVVAGIQWCIDNDIQIINMSFGTLVHSEILEEAVKKAEAAGILMVASVGNGGEATEDNVEYPAAFSEVIGVGSVDENMEISSFSSRGEQVELLAPGENVPVSTKWGFYSVDSGTSYAAPHVTALAALLWSQDGSKTSEEIRDILKKSANTIDGDGNNTYGIVDYTQAKEVAKDYTGVEDDEKSYQSQRELESFDVPEVVQANWASNDGTPTEGNHSWLIVNSGKTGSYNALELSALYYYVAYADNHSDVYEYEGKTLSEYRVLHAGKYSSDTDIYNIRKVNYVAATRCLYDCAYMLANDADVTVAELKEYCSQYYNNYNQTTNQVKMCRQDLRRLVQLICSNKLPNVTNSTITGKELWKLQLLSFSIHAATDAFAHQYVINHNLTDKILNNSYKELGITKNSTKFTYVSKTESKLESGKSSTKDIEYLSNNKSIWHSVYSDNIEFQNERYTIGARQATTMMLDLYRYKSANTIITKKFVPLIFVNTYFRKDCSTYRIPIYDLEGNSVNAGYSLPDFAGNMPLTGWYKLSYWK